MAPGGQVARDWGSEERASRRASGSTSLKIATLIFGILGLVGLILAIVLFSSGGSQCLSTANVSSGTCSSTQAVGTIGLGLLVLVVALVFTFVGWILGIVKTAMIGRWGWFVAVLLLSPLGSVLYGIFGPAHRVEEREPAHVA